MLYLQSTPLVEEAIVNNVLDRAFDVIILKFGIVSRVYLDQLPLEGFKFSSQAERRSLQLKWPVAKACDPLIQTIAVSSAVTVRLTVHPEDRTKLVVSRIRPHQSYSNRYFSCLAVRPYAPGHSALICGVVF